MEMRIWTLLLAIVKIYLVSSASEKVSETECTKDGADQCKDILNAECDNLASDPKCKCSDGFAEDKIDGSTCEQKKVSETECTKDGADQCKDIPNAECDNDASDAKCKCSNGFAEDKTDGSTCVKIIGGDCPGKVTCTDTGYASCIDRKCACNNDYGEKNNICVRKKVSETECTKDGVDQCKHTPNAECTNDASDAKCKCSNGFAEDKTEGSTCVKIIGGICATAVTCTDTDNAGCTSGKCTCNNYYGEKDNICVQTVSGTNCEEGGNECDSIQNSYCDSPKCKCDDGFVMNVNVCSADSAGKSTAAMIQFGTMTVLLTVLTITPQLFK